VRSLSGAFYFGIFVCFQSGDHPQEDATKKKEKKK
jgi:hypothetical protein